MIATRNEMTDLLLTLRGANQDGRRLKQATIGGDPEQSFEQAFSQLGFAYIKDKAPRLLDNLKGFQLIERNEDNTRAVGVFGAQLNREWVYLPIFFLNGDLKGHELLYMKNQDLFVPLKENWVNYLLSKQPHVLGSGVNGTLRELGIMQPELRRLSIPPYATKYAAAGWEPWAIEFLPILGRLTTESPKGLYQESELVPKIAAAHLGFAKALKKACDTNPEFDRLCRNFYGQNFLAEALTSLRQKVAQSLAQPEHNILRPIPCPGQVSALHGFRPMKRAAADDDVVKITVKEDVITTPHEFNLTDEERERVLDDGFLVEDRRTGDEITKAYSTEVGMSLDNPAESGIYDVLVKPGKFEKMMIVVSPATGKSRQDFVTIVRTGDKKNWINAASTSVWVKPDSRSLEEHRKDFEALSGTESLGRDGVYMAVFVNQHGRIDGSTPFTVRKDLGDGRYKVWWMDDCDCGRPTALSALLRGRAGSRPFHVSGSGPNWGMDSELSGSGDLLFLSDRPGTSLRIMQGTLLIPDEHKIISLSDPNEDCCMSSQSENPPIEPGDWGDIQMEILQKSAGLAILDRGDVWLNEQRFAPREALFSLIRDHGLREKDAREMLREASRAGQYKAAAFRLKYADGYPRLTGGGTGADYGPEMMDEEYGYMENYAGVPATGPREVERQISDLSSSNTDPGIYDPSPEMMADPMAMQSATRSGQKGQKEVFDTSVVAGLLKSTRQDALVDRYLGDLMKGLDRLGRLLFVFYWHNNEFSDRYGDADIPELEDTLRNAFEILGDLVLFLKEKDVGGLPGISTGAPSVQESAD